MLMNYLFRLHIKLQRRIRYKLMLTVDQDAVRVNLDFPMCIILIAKLHTYHHSDQARHVRNEVSALPDTRDKIARV